MGCLWSQSDVERWEDLGESRNAVNRPTEKNLAESEGNLKDLPYFFTSNSLLKMFSFP